MVCRLQLNKPYSDFVSRCIECFIFLFTIAVKAGKVSDKDLQLLSGKLVGDKWKKLGRRLEVDEAKISAYHKQHEELDEKAYHMLRDWKERKGSGATYEVLYDALCDEERVACRNLAEEICCVQSS